MPHLATRSMYVPAEMSHLEPNADARSVRFSLVWLSKAGFSILQLTKTHMWFLTMKGFTFAVLCFLLIFSTSALRGAASHARGPEWLNTCSYQHDWEQKPISGR
eukprot:354903-Chlamydomonas_euryale.AAC.36